MPAPADPQQAIVILAIHRPDPVLFHRMLGSIQAQEGVDCRICAVIDGDAGGVDASVMAALEAVSAHVHPVADRLGVRGAFATGLGAALDLAEGTGITAFAFADQDDVWRPDKLARSIAELDRSGCGLVHSDARVVSSTGTVIAPSLHRFERREGNTEPLDALLLNDVTGMTAVFTPQTARRALHLMQDLDAAVLHDHVTALAASFSGGVAWIDEPLADYVQHDANEVGAVGRGRGRWWRIGWLLHMKAYRAHSLKIFRERRRLVLKMADQGAELGDLGTMFLVGGNPGWFATFAAYWRAGNRYFWRGQFRHWHLMIRCSDAALYRRSLIRSGCDGKDGR